MQNSAQSCGWGPQVIGKEMERKRLALGLLGLLSLMTEATNTAEQSGRWARKQTMAIKAGGCSRRIGKHPTNGMQTQPPSSENLELCGKRRARMTLLERKKNL